MILKRGRYQRPQECIHQMDPRFCAECKSDPKLFRVLNANPAHLKYEEKRAKDE